MTAGGLRDRFGVELSAADDGSLRVAAPSLLLHARQLRDALARLRFVWRAFPDGLRRAWTIHLRPDGSVDVTRDP